MATHDHLRHQTVYPITNFKFGQKSAKVEKDTSVSARMSRMRNKYETEGPRRSVEAVLVVHQVREEKRRGAVGKEKSTTLDAVSKRETEREKQRERERERERLTSLSRIILSGCVLGYEAPRYCGRTHQIHHGRYGKEREARQALPS